MSFDASELTGLGSVPTAGQLSAGGAPVLTASEVGFGSVGNLLTGSPNLTWTNATQQLTVTGRGNFGTADMILNVPTAQIAQFSRRINNSEIWGEYTTASGPTNALGTAGVTDSFTWTDSGFNIVGQIQPNSKDCGFGSQALLPTNSTRGFLWVPSVNGVPTGVPAGGSGFGNQTPIVVDTPGLRVYFFIAGAWHFAALT